MFMITKPIITHKEFMKVCSKKVAEYENKRKDISVEVDRDDVFPVWSCKTLQNSKCLMSCSHQGAHYYEFTMNGDGGEIYMDVYSKVTNVPLDVDGCEISNTPKPRTKSKTTKSKKGIVNGYETKASRC